VSGKTSKLMLGAGRGRQIPRLNQNASAGGAVKRTSSPSTETNATPERSLAADSFWAPTCDIPGHCGSSEMAGFKSANLPAIVGLCRVNFLIVTS
jgi:hypothetical protein